MFCFVGGCVLFVLGWENGDALKICKKQKKKYE